MVRHLPPPPPFPSPQVHHYCHHRCRHNLSLPLLRRPLPVVPPPPPQLLGPGGVPPAGGCIASTRRRASPPCHPCRVFPHDVIQYATHENGPNTLFGMQQRPPPRPPMAVNFNVFVVAIIVEAKEPLEEFPLPGPILGRVEVEQHRRRPPTAATAAADGQRQYSHPPLRSNSSNLRLKTSRSSLISLEIRLRQRYAHAVGTMQHATRKAHYVM